MSVNDKAAVQLREARPSDAPALARLRARLWPDQSVADHETELRQLLAGAGRGTWPLVIVVAEQAGRPVGFAEAGLRSHADGCDPTRPCGYLEGWYVEPDHSRQGVGRALVQWVEGWALGQGCRELASDTWADRPASQRAHEALGFERVDRCVTYRKTLQDRKGLQTAEHGGNAASGGFYGTSLAELHHQAFGHLARAAAGDLVTALAAAGHETGRVVDLGGGSGILSARLLEAGYEATCVDTSSSMLDLAALTAPGVSRVQSSAWDVALPRCVAVCAVGEVLSYTTGDDQAGPARLALRLAEVRAALVPGGLLLCDVVGAGRAGASGRRQRLWERAGLTVTLDETEESGPPTRLVRDIQVFSPDGERWRRHQERHELVGYDFDEVERVLRETGFEVQRRPGYAGERLGEGWCVFLATRRG